MKPKKQSLVNRLQILTLSWKSWRLVGSLANLAQMLHNTWLQNSCSSSVCGLKFIAGSSNFLMFILFISIWTKMNFLFTWRIFCRNRSSGAWCSIRFVWCSWRRTIDSFRILLTQVFTLGVACSLVFWSRYCVIVHVGILIASFESKQSYAMIWLLLRASRCSERFANTFTHVHHLSVVSICLLWMLLL